jgi:serine/threonine-protein kinase
VVDLVAGRYAGHPLADVQAELTALGLVVRPRPTTTNDVPDGQVIAVEPVGQVVVGQTVSVTYAVAPAAHAPNGNGHGNGHGHRSDGDPGD